MFESIVTVNCQAFSPQNFPAIRWLDHAGEDLGIIKVLSLHAYMQFKRTVNSRYSELLSYKFSVDVDYIICAVETLLSMTYIANKLTKFYDVNFHGVNHLIMLCIILPYTCIIHRILQPCS